LPETHVLWLNTRDAASFEEGIYTISRLLADSGSQETEATSVQQIEGWLRNKANGNWLLVLDDVDDVRWLLENTPGGRRINDLQSVSHGSILVTLRDNEVASRLAHSDSIIALDQLSEQEALSFLRAKISDWNFGDDDMDRLARGVNVLLHRSPLEFVQMLRIVQKRLVTVKCLLKELSAMNEQVTPRYMSWLTAEPYEISHADAASPWLLFAETRSAKANSATVSYVDPSRTAKDSGYGSYESGSIVQEGTEEQKEEASELISVRTLSSFVDLGLHGRLRGINMFASDLVQSLSPDIAEIVEGRELVVVAVQDALRAYSYSLEQQNRFSKLSDERKAAHFIRQQSQ
jgi:hypothetical protein